MPERHATDLLSRFWDFKKNGDGTYSVPLPIDPKKIAQSIGMTVIPYTDDEILQMKLKMFDEDYRDRVGELDGTTIKYRPDTVLPRQRFTIAHELGHYVLGHGHSFRSDPCVSTPVETAANAFAAELLMPKELVRFLVEVKKVKNVEDLAGLFGMSMQAMTIRLVNLGYIRV